MKLLKWISLFLFSTTALAMQDVGLGRVAENMLDPVGLFEEFISTGSIILGVSFLMASIIKYAEHRRSPLMVPISTVVFLIIAGIFLLALPLTYYITENGIPYSLYLLFKT